MFSFFFSYRFCDLDGEQDCSGKTLRNIYLITFQMAHKKQHLACMLSKSHKMANLLSLFSKPKTEKSQKIELSLSCVKGH